MSFSTADAIKRGVEENFMAICKGGSQVPGFSYLEGDFATEVVTPLTTTWMNGVLKTDAGVPDLEERVRATLSKYKTPMLWRIGPETKEPERLQDLLTSLGLRVVERSPAMSLQFDVFKPNPIPDGFRIELVKTEEQVDGFLDPMCEGFNMDESTRAHFRNYALNVAIPSENETWFVGYAGDKIVTSGTLYTACGINMIYNICTTAPYRKRGFAAAMVEHLVSIAPDLPNTPVCLYASAMGFPIYSKLGFKEEFIRVDYEYIPNE